MPYPRSMTERLHHEHVEIELKFEAADGLALPAEIATGLSRGSHEEHQLHARYYDTDDARLARAGLALRRRAGGHDEGWHLKRRLSKRAQHELTWPLSGDIPQAALDEIHTHVPLEKGELRVTAEINTVRRVVTFENAQGVPVVEVSDDSVLSKHRSSRTVRAWREWEAELVDANAGSEAEREELLAEVSRNLQAAGAQPSLSDSKIARAVGALYPRAVKQGADAMNVAALAVLEAADTLAGRFSEGEIGADRARVISELRAISHAIAGGTYTEAES